MNEHFFSNILGGDALPDYALKIFKSCDWTRRAVVNQERILLSVLKELNRLHELGTLAVVSSEGRRESRAGVWERCYEEVALEGTLTPPYLRPNEGMPIRLQGRYEVPHRPEFELNFLRVLRAYLFDKYMREVARVFEFGCGTGHNLFAYAEQFPGVALHGFERSMAAVRHGNRVAQYRQVPITFQQFDFFNMRPSAHIDCCEAAVFTVGALEQVGSNYGGFLGCMLAARPRIVVHVEPILELYDENLWFDYLAVMYHARRGYLRGYWPTLAQLRSEGKIEVLELRRLPFSSMYHDAYTILAWRPR